MSTALPGDVTAMPGFVRIEPVIEVGTKPAPLAGATADRLVRVVVDQHAHRPDMFEITFAAERSGEPLDLSPFAIGTPVSISSAGILHDEVTVLVKGEITAIEGDFGQVSNTVIRGYAADHRLQRRRRSRTFQDVLDSDVAEQIAGEHRLKVGRVDRTRATYPHLGQVNQTDWEFLRWRAATIGYDVGVRDGEFFFTKAAAAKTARRVVALTFPDTLRAFAPRVTAGNLAANAEVRAWDPVARRVVAAVTTPTSASVDVPGSAPGGNARPFGPTTPAKPGKAQRSELGDVGPAPDGNAVVVLSAGAGDAAELAEAAGGLAERVGSTAAEAEGDAVGDPRLKAGTVVEVDGVGDPFDGRWTISRAVHVFDRRWYSTRFEVSGRNERSLLGLAACGPTPGPTIPGVVCGVVTNVGDPDKLGRVKVALPWLSPGFETDWAVVVNPGAGTRGGSLFQPAVRDQVLVAFQLGDPRRPFVLGGLFHRDGAAGLGADPVKRNGAAAEVVRRGIVTPSGNRLSFHDEVTSGAKPTVTAARLVLGTGGEDMALSVDQVSGEVRLVAAPTGRTPAKKGTVLIECGRAGEVRVVAGKGGTVTVESGGVLELSGETVSLKGKTVKIDGTAAVEITGKIIKLN
jgi:phage protein D